MANIETTAELNKLLGQQNKLLAAQAKIMKSQAASMKAMMSTMQKMPVEEVSKSFQAMNDAIEDADKALEEFSSDQEKMLKDVSDGAEDATGKFGSMTKKINDLTKTGLKIAPVVAMFTGMNAGLRAGVGIFGSMVSVVGTLTKSMLSLGVAIITAPFKMLNALMAEAANFSGTEFRQALEDLRKEMGDISRNEGQAVIKTFRNMRKEGTMTGLGVYRVFGNMAERLKEMNRIATAMGRAFGNMTEEFMAHGRQIGEYTKGLGLSEEGIKAVTAAAQAEGKEFIEVGREITTMSYGMGEAFGINGKLISKDISEMIGDFESFGNVGVKEMSQIAVFTRKLGIEVKDLMGTIGQFDDFETAAQSAAQLSQAFGIQVDTLEMLKEQDPAARFENMRKSFLATGRSVEDLTRQELKLLSTQTGISAEALKVGFSQSKAGLSYEEVQKQAEKTEKKQLSQAEAMEKLSMSIELMVKSGQQMQGGFFDIFIQGFGRGVKIGGEFRQLMRTLHRAMRSTFIAGRQVGRMFVKEFPGVADVLKGIRDIFDPKTFGGFKRTSGGFVSMGFLGDVIKDFRKFFKEMTTSPKVALGNLFDRLKKDFFDMFSKSSPAGQKVLSGFKTFFVAMGQIFGAGIRIAMQGFTDGLKFLSEFIKDPSAALAAAKAGQSGFAKFITSVFEPAWQAIVDQWPALQAAMVELWNVAWTKFGPIVKDFAWKAAKYIGKGVIFAGVSRALVAGALSAIGLAAGGILKKGTPILGNALGKVFGDAPKSSGFEQQTKVTQEAMENMTTLGPTMTAFSKIPFKTIAMAALKGVVAIGVLTTGMAVNFLAINAIVGDVKPAEITKVLKTMGVMGALYLEAGLVILESVAVGAVISIPPLAVVALAGLAAIASVATGMAAHAVGIISTISSMRIGTGVERKVKVFTDVVGAMAEMAKTLVSIMKAATPTFSSIRGLFTGENPMLAGLEAVNGIMDGIANHVRSILLTINSMIRDVSPAQLEAGKMFGTLLSAVGSVVQALLPPPEMAGSFMEKVIGIDTLGAVSSHMKRTSKIIQDMVPTLIGLIGTVPANINTAAVETFSSFMTGISSLFQALVPPPGLMESLKSSKKSSIAWGLIQTETSNAEGISDGFNSMRSFMNKMIESVTGSGGAMEKIQEFMVGFVGRMSKAGSPEQIAAAAGIFDATIEAMGSLTDIFSPEKMEAFQKSGNLSGAGVLLSTFNSRIMMPLMQDMPMLLDNFGSVGIVAAKVKKGFIKKTGRAVHDLVSEINGVTAALNKMEPKNIKVQMKDLSNKLGLKGSDSLSVNLNDIKMTINVEVYLDADNFEEALINKPGKSKFVIDRSTK
jgi:Mg2+ and Co2+ transporter CorA